MTQSLPDTFAALGDATRLAIIDRLLTSGEQPAGALQDVADISAPALSRHLKVLHNAGLVTRRVDAQRRLYAVRPEAVQAINDWTMSYRDFWSGSLDRLEAAIRKGGQS